jgi:hypothetical protein
MVQVYSSLMTSVLALVYENCTLTNSTFTYNLTCLAGVQFVGYPSPKITCVVGEPLLKILSHGAADPPTLEVVEGKIVVKASSCAAAVTPAVPSPVASPMASPVVATSPTAPGSSKGSSQSGLRRVSSMATMLAATAASSFVCSTEGTVLLAGLTLLSMLTTGVSGQEVTTCDSILEVEIHGPEKTLGTKVCVSFVGRCLHHDTD